MATPKKKLSKIKTKIRKKFWKNKAKKNALNALNWSKIFFNNKKN